MTKKVRISLDSGTTWNTFPGDTADLQQTGTAIKDTVFGQNYESNQTGMLAWTLSANGFYKGFAGYIADVKASGTSTSTTSEATTNLQSHVYQITNTAKQVIDRTQTVTVHDGATNITAQVISIDYLFGIITLNSGYTVVGAITADYHYLPMANIAKANAFTLTQTAATKDISDFISAQGNNGYKLMDYGLQTVSLDLQGIFAVSNGWLNALQTRSEVMIEINPDGAEGSIARGIFKPITHQQAGKVGDVETEQVKFDLSVPDPSLYPLLVQPFGWVHTASSTLSTALKNALNAWTSLNSGAMFQYLEDGTNGQQGTGIITDISLTGGLDVMNTFALKVAGTGQLTTVGTG